MNKLLFALVFALPALAAEQRLQLTPENTQVTWTLSDPHTVRGTFQLTRGEVTFDTATGKAGGEVVVNVRSGESGNGTRDRRMHSQVLESAQYPEAVFRPDRLEGALSPRGASSMKLHGSFQLHGSAHEITMRVEVKAAPGQMDTTIAFDVPYVAWGMKDPSNFLLKVGKTVQMEIHTTALPQP